MELHRRLNNRRPLWRVSGIFWSVVVMANVLKLSSADPIVVHELPTKRFVVTEESFEYSDFRENCQKIDGEIAELDNNAEFREVRLGVYNNLTTRGQDIYISTTRIWSHGWYRYYWASSEEVLSTYWWTGEPNLRSLQPESGTVSQCSGYKFQCRPTAMSCHDLDDGTFQEALLFDTCCRRVNPGLCVQVSGVDECADPSKHSCPANTECVDEEYSYTCQCLSGYERDDAATGCVDTDECARQTHSCPADSTCVNTQGGFTCNCQAGFLYVNNACVDTDECARQTHSCPADSTCVNTQGGFTCNCQAGFLYDNNACVDVDECEDDRLFSCTDNSTCTNTVGSYSCPCDAGFLSVGYTCDDINECTSQALHRCPANSACANTIGSYGCSCISGFTKDGENCVDINECTSQALHRCPANSACANTIGSYGCSCISGFTKDGEHCVDIDECSLGAFFCWANSECSNTVGSYICRCIFGFVDHGGRCVAAPPPGTTAPPPRATAPPPGATTPPPAETTPPPGTTAPPPGATAPSPGATAPPPGATTPPPAETTPPPGTTSPPPGTTTPPPGATTPPPAGTTPPSALGATAPPPAGTATPSGATAPPPAPGATTPPSAPTVTPPPSALVVEVCGYITCHMNSECDNTNILCVCKTGFISHDSGLTCDDINECDSSTLYTCPSHSSCVNLNGAYECECDNGYFKNEVGLCEEVPKESFKLRTCPCVCPALVEEVLNNLPDAKESSDTIQKELEVKPNKLATTVRKKVSASDERGSSASFGIIALTLLGLEFFLVTIGDLITVLYFFKQKLGQLICTRI